jgi:hypothetical protein
MPKVLKSVRDRVLDEQDDAFDVPIQLAAEICGFYHDRWKVDCIPIFSRLEPAKVFDKAQNC